MTSASPKFRVRDATVDDSEAILALVRELNEFEKISDAVTIPVENFKRDGFGERKYFDCLVADLSEEGEVPTIVGYCLYVYSYSTLQGRVLCIEDIFVQTAYRRIGIGKAFWREVAKKAMENYCSQMKWSVLAWNQKAIDFYESMGATNEAGLLEYQMGRASIAECAQEPT